MYLSAHFGLGVGASLNVIIRSATTQGQLVEDLLDLSRIVTGRMAAAASK